MCVRDNERSLMSPVFFFLIKIFLIRVAEQEKVLTKQNLVRRFWDRQNLNFSSSHSHTLSLSFKKTNEKL